MQISATSVFVSPIKNSLRPAVWWPHDKTDDSNLAQNTPSSVGLNRRRFYSECTNQPRLLSHAASRSGRRWLDETPENIVAGDFWPEGLAQLVRVAAAVKR